MGSKAKYWLVPRGDTPSSSRLYDSIHFGAMPIVISDDFEKVGMPYPDDFPWDRVLTFIGQDAFAQDPVGEVRSAMQRKRYHAFKRTLPLAHAALDWTAPGNCQA